MRPKDIFNGDETACFFKAMPPKTYAFVCENVIGDKQSKDQLTVVVCTNMDGTERLTPIVVGKVIPNSLEELMQYCNTVVNGMMISFCYKTMKCTTHFFRPNVACSTLIEWLHVQYCFNFHFQIWSHNCTVRGRVL